MTVIVKPKGRGRWKPMQMTLDGRHRMLPMLLRRGQLFELGGVTWRICEVRP